MLPVNFVNILVFHSIYVATCLCFHFDFWSLRKKTRVWIFDQQMLHFDPRGYGFPWPEVGLLDAVLRVPHGARHGSQGLRHSPRSAHEASSAQLSLRPSVCLSARYSHDTLRPLPTLGFSARLSVSIFLLLPLRIHQRLKDG